MVAVSPQETLDLVKVTALLLLRVMVVHRKAMVLPPRAMAHLKDTEILGQDNVNLLLLKVVAVTSLAVGAQCSFELKKWPTRLYRVD